MSSQSQSIHQNPGLLNLNESCVFYTTQNCHSLALPSQQSEATAKSRSASVHLQNLLSCPWELIHAPSTAAFTTCESLLFSLQGAVQVSPPPLRSLAFPAMPPHPEALPQVQDKHPFSLLPQHPGYTRATVLRTALPLHCTSLTRHKLLEESSYLFWCHQILEQQSTISARDGAALWMPMASHSNSWPFLFSGNLRPCMLSTS